MTEARWQAAIVALESGRDDAARQAGDLSELAAIIGGARDQLAELMLDARVRAATLDRNIAAIRLVLAEAESRAQTMSVARGVTCEALTKIVGPPATSSEAAADAAEITRPMSLDEIAEMRAKDERAQEES